MPYQENTKPEPQPYTPIAVQVGNHWQTGFFWEPANMGLWLVYLNAGESGYYSRHILAAKVWVLGDECAQPQPAEPEDTEIDELKAKVQALSDEPDYYARLEKGLPLLETLVNKTIEMHHETKQLIASLDPMVDQPQPLPANQVELNPLCPPADFTQPAPMPDMSILAKIEESADEPREIPLQILDTIDAYIEAVSPDEFEELMQLAADKERISQEIIEARETRNEQRDTLRPNARANAGQLRAIATWIARYASHHEHDWFYRFTRSLFGHGVEMNHLTVAQASQVEIALAQINGNRAYGSAWNTANLALDIHYKFDLYPDDWERAKVEFRECQQRFCYQVSMGRVNHPKHLTHGEALDYAKLVNAALPTLAIH